MKPIAVNYHSKKGFQIIHKCLKCGIQKMNIIAQDTEQPDNLQKMIELLKSEV